MSDSKEVAKKEAAAVGKAKMERTTIVPSVDIFENSNEIVMLADMPGVTKDTLLVNLEDDILTVEGTVALKFAEDAAPILTEQISGRYARNFTLSRELDKDKIEASMQNGILRLTIPKSETHKPRKIEVQGT